MASVGELNREAVDQYLDYIASVRLLSSKTVRSYENDLRKLELFLNERSIPIYEITHEDARRFAASLMTGAYKETSINRFLAAARGFYRHAYIMEKCTYDPFEQISSQKRGRRLPSVLTLEEVRSVINQIPTDFISLRDILMFNIFYCTGCRLSELLDIRTDTIEYDQKRILVHGKGDKDRYVFLTETVVTMIHRYLEQRSSFYGYSIASSKLLFINHFGKRLSPSSVHSIFRKYQLKLGINKRFTPHVFRHSFATHMLDNDSGIRVVQELLGHASISTTQIYSHVSNERLKRVYESCHPHGRKK